MTGPESTPAAAQALTTPQVVVVGAACRDLDRTDRRGWRLGGAVAFGALALARLGLRVGAVLGADPHAARAPELDLLRIDGVDVRLVPLERGAVFENTESPNGRVQRAFAASDPIPPASSPAEWAATGAWLLAPVASELDDRWAAVPPEPAFVALGWQGLLRELVPNGVVQRRAPSASALLQRADLVGVSRDDLKPDVDLPALGQLLRPDAALVLTHGASGGIVLIEADGELRPTRRYPAMAVDPRDPTGAGDVFLAALVAARLGAGLGGAGPVSSAATPGPQDLRFAATVAGLAVERAGLNGIPDASAVRRRLRERLIAFR
ncbi:MAG: hypothetical protein FJ038_06605 [Chloroflexi bacterium]|nr:hypothetical protein [Chloroflexota bacterium]